MPTHKQIRMMNPFTQVKVSVDVAMSGLIQALWDHRIKTKESCQENGAGKQAYIVFESGYDFQQFIRFAVYGKMKGFTHWEYHDGWNIKFEPALIEPLQKLFWGERRVTS